MSVQLFIKDQNGDFIPFADINPKSTKTITNQQPSPPPPKTAWEEYRDLSIEAKNELFFMGVDPPKPDREDY